MNILIAIAAGLAGLLVLIVAVVAFLLIHRVKGRFFDSNGVKIHFTEQGSGEPVILVHGFAANQDLNWRIPGMIRALSRDYRVIAMDVRGHALSDAPHEENAYGMEMIHDIARLMDHLGIPKAHVVGYSMGGFIVLSFCATHPDRAISCVAAGAGWFPEKKYPKMVTELPDALRKERSMRPIMTFFDRRTSLPARIQMAVTNFVLMKMFDPLALASCFGSMTEMDGTEEQLRGNKVPLLSVIGTRDPLKKAVDNMIGKTGNHEVLFIEGKDHVGVPLSGAFKSGIKAFLKKHSQSGAKGR
ncbi:MAG TPA: alpha/beta hydrolase [Candidatus Brocadiia bacterium]|nr:alpha/beta hydrolase [Candidatus Brocadiia bacterium]